MSQNGNLDKPLALKTMKSFCLLDMICKTLFSMFGETFSSSKRSSIELRGQMYRTNINNGRIWSYSENRVYLIYSSLQP